MSEIGDIDISPILEKGSHHFHAPTGSCPHQGRLPKRLAQRTILSLFSVEENTGGLYISTKHSNGDARTGEASDAVRVYVPEPPWGERGAEQLQGEGSAGGERGVALRNDDA
ncbi:hypothetical protein MAR_000422 [Mya arenaria]|uniref:Uncharacterized protein n=1 Tax=Mya arenaria TaxID=6604 RepID=A0ABY7FB49_MYAAR|nr:hypothetical protein MAR_000422 [Mya arenaria]